MSLFQAREWWGHRIEAEEEFDSGGLVVGNVDNDPSGQAKILTGSLAGVLRIYFPRSKDYKVDDLMLEMDLGAPILQLAIGRFLPTAGGNALAVLHPRKLEVYTVVAEGGTGSVSYMKLTKAYEHSLGVDGLHFTACNMCHGPFGGGYGKDYICVQSMDGQLSFFEQDRPSFTRQLEHCLMPGPITYVSKTDSIVTATAAMTIESYKYQMLAAASLAHPSERREDDAEEESGKAGTGRALKVDWSVNVGEHVHSLTVGRFSSSLRASQVDIVVIGEHTLFCLREAGGSQPIRMQKRLDYYPAAHTLYDFAPPGRESMNNLIVASHTSQLMVYRDTKLVWAARVDVQPIALAVAQFGPTRGLVVTLAESGEVRVSYMGTDPPVSNVGGGDTKELNYEEMDEEHRQLLTVIRETQSDSRAEPRDRVLLRTQVRPTLDEDVEEEEDVWGTAGWDGFGMPRGSIAQLTCPLFVSYTGTDTIKDVTVTVKVPDSVTAKESSLHLPTLAGGARTPLVIPLVFRARTTGMPSNLKVQVAAAHSNERGEPRITVHEFELPMCLCSRLVPPLKSNTFKFTLDTNRLPPPLPVLFDDMFKQPGLTDDAIQRITSSSANVLSFQYFNGADATILVSKTAGRYRIQSGALESLWLVSSELVRRLKDHFASDAAGGRDRKEEEPFQLVYSEPLPLADFFACIDDHFDCRHTLAQALSDVNDRAHQFRLIQKRLLVRFKDRNPAPLSNLDVVMHQTHEELIDLGERVEGAQRALLAAANRLTCATYLLLMLIRYRFALDDANYAVLEAHLTPHVVDTEDQGWEECIDAAVTHLLRTALAKTARETAGVPPPLAMPADTSKLKKHLSYLCERLSKGIPLVHRGRRSRKPAATSS